MTLPSPFEYRILPSAVLDVTGDDRAAFLQGQITQDVGRARPGVTVPTAGLTPKGKILYVARLVGLADRLRLVLPGVLAAPVLAHLSKYAVFQKVAISDRSAELARVGIAGGPAPAGPSDALRLGPEGEFSDELLVPSETLEAALRALDLAGGRPMNAARGEILRVEAGRPDFGVDFDETNLPDEVGLGEAVSSTKGCYVGQEIVARMRTYGRVNRRLVGFRFPDGPVPAGQRLERGVSETSRVEPGRVTSSVISPRWGPIGLGWISRDVEFGDALISRAGGGASLRAIASPVPFA